MKLKIDFTDFSINNKVEIQDIYNSVRYWSQPDFSYKKRVHIYDDKNNEIGYVQYIILSSQDEVLYFDKNNKPIDIKDYKVTKYTSELSYKLEYNESEVASINLVDNVCEIDIFDETHINNCLLKIYGEMN